MGFKDKIEKIEENKPGYGDKILVWVHGTGWPVDRDDLDAFCSHMDDWYSISGRSFTRTEYEDACYRLGIIPISDCDIGGYGSEYGDFGMDHYHTVPENRLGGIVGTLMQGRWWGMEKENPNIIKERRIAEDKRREDMRLEALRKTYPEDLDKWITSVGGIEVIYEKMLSMHQGNRHQLREEGRHFEWLIGHSCMGLGMEASIKHPDYVPGDNFGDRAVYPLFPKWWGGWSETDDLHPINRIAEMLSDRRIEPYQGKIEYFGYGEDCGDDVRQNLKDFLGV